MTMEEVKAWALAHGFRHNGGSGMVAAYGDLSVTLDFRRHEVRSRVTRMGAAVDLGTFAPSNVFGPQGESEAVEGLGLGESFVERFGGKERRVPVWAEDVAASATLAP